CLVGSRVRACRSGCSSSSSSAFRSLDPPAEPLGGGVQGAALTIALLVVDSIIGSLLLRSQGRAVWRRFNLALQEGRVPHREVVDGILIIAGGALLLTPGFISDILGAVLLIPPTRALI